MSFVMYSRKTGKCWKQNFFIGSWKELCWWNRFCQTSILALWLVTPPCFLAKIAQILQKVIVFLPERGEELKPWFWHIWIAQRLKLFHTNAYCFRFQLSSVGKQGANVGPKILSFGPSLFHKNSNPSKMFQKNFLFARVLTLVRISAILDYIWGSKGPNISQKGLLTTTNAILMKLTKIMYLHESANQKGLISGLISGHF